MRPLNGGSLRAQLRAALAGGLVLAAAAAGAARAAPEPPARSSAAAPAPAPPPAAEAKPAEPAAIPLPAIIRSAEEAYRTLARLGDKVDDDAAQQDVRERLPRTRELVEKLRPAVSEEQMAGLLPLDVNDLRQALLRHEQQLSRWDGKLEDAARTLFGAVAELRRMEVTWALTEEAARASHAPEALLVRIGELRARIRATWDRAQAALGQTLELEDRVASLRLQIGDWIAAADRAERAREDQLFEIESAPLWKLLGRPSQGAKLREQVVRSLRLQVGAVRSFAAAEVGWLCFLGVLLAVLAVAIARLATRFRSRAAEDPALRAPAEVLRHPLAVSSLLTLALVPWVFPRMPVTVAELTILAMLPAFLRAMGGILPPRVRLSAYGLAVTFAVSRVEALAPEHSLLGRLLLLAVAAAALAGLLRERRLGFWRAELPTEAWRRFVRFLANLAVVAFVVSMVASVVGNVSLARRLANGTLASAAIAALVFGTALVVGALYVGLLRMPSAKRIGLVARHGALLEERGRKYIRWAAIALWLYVSENIFRIAQPLEEVIGTVLSQRLKVGGLDVSLGDVVAFAITLWVAVLLARLLSFLLEEGLEGRGLPRGVPAAISKSAGYAVVAVGFGFAILASGMEVTRFTVIVGTLGVGIGFGLQNVVNNFVSGLILLYERPVQVGDVVEVGNVQGVVRRIGIRSSTIRTFPGAEVVLPNANLISGELVNWTLSDRLRRVDMSVGVAYGSDPERVIAILLAAAGRFDGVLKEPAPTALFTGFGESSLDFQLRFWTHRFDSYLSLASDVRLAICRGLDEAGISIPFPQRDLHLVSVDPGAVRVLAEGAGGEEAPVRGRPAGPGVGGG
ncbi:MAG TPA: mechanosensitive ion channel domain-containing protein [Anaeromyxobacteraceae bacterium]|nr:mechanosensitive ion channel domain-containing protein [Anaeromyxobacteraceae bacterium]